MKLMSSLVLFALLLMQCISGPLFPHIEEQRLRIVGINFRPTPDYAPGDTATFTLYSAGVDLTLADRFYTATDIKWGEQSDEIVGASPLSITGRKDFYPDSVVVSYVIPRDFFLTNPNDEKLPSSLVKQGVSTIDSLLAGQIPDELDTSRLYTFVNSCYKTMYLFCTVTSAAGKQLDVKSSYMVRYNNKFQPLFDVNHNPDIQWITWYQVPVSFKEQFSPTKMASLPGCSSQFLKHALLPASVRDTVTIDTGYVYFLSTDSGRITIPLTNGTLFSRNLYDSATTVTGAIEEEEFRYQWFYENVNAGDKEPDSLVSLDFDKSEFPLVNPSLDPEIQHARFYVIRRDQLFRAIRPQGQAAAMVNCYFKYTSAYINSVAKN